MFSDESIAFWEAWQREYNKLGHVLCTWTVTEDGDDLVYENQCSSLCRATEPKIHRVKGQAKEIREEDQRFSEMTDLFIKAMTKALNDEAAKVLSGDR